MHVKFTDVTLWKLYLEKVNIISVFITIISFFGSIQNCHKKIQIVIFVVFCVGLVSTFLIMWWNANQKKVVIQFYTWPICKKDDRRWEVRGSK